MMRITKADAIINGIRTDCILTIWRDVETGAGLSSGWRVDFVLPPNRTISEPCRVGVRIGPREGTACVSHIEARALSMRLRLEGVAPLEELTG
jgi:hypothetical protein